MSFADWIFPKKCLQCGKSGIYLCQKCTVKVRLARQVCIECQKPSIDGITHSGCFRPFGLDGSVSSFEYKGVVKKAVKSLKYRFATDIAGELVDLLVSSLMKNINALPNEPILVPIPLHKKRQNWRGFNQAEELGKILSTKLEVRFVNDVFVRTKYTIPQVELKGEKRRGNVKGIFQLKNKYQKFLEQQTSLVLFDDVITTGATIKEACKVVKRNNKELIVWGLSVAR